MEIWCYEIIKDLLSPKSYKFGVAEKGDSNTIMSKRILITLSTIVFSLHY